MGWFDHRHYWRPKTALNTIVEPGSATPTGGLIVEDCACGAVRTIEFMPGQAPTVRMAEHLAPKVTHNLSEPKI